MKNLFDSNVFSMTFDFDEWPSTHSNSEECSRPYIYNIFEMRDKYSKVFPGDDFAPVDQNAGKEKIRYYKIKYQLNLLPKCAEYIIPDPEDSSKKVFHNEGLSLMDLTGSSDELEIFDTKNL